MEKVSCSLQRQYKHGFAEDFLWRETVSQVSNLSMGLLFTVYMFYRPQYKKQNAMFLLFTTTCILQLCAESNKYTVNITLHLNRKIIVYIKQNPMRNCLGYITTNKVMSALNIVIESSIRQSMKSKTEAQRNV